MRPVQIMSIPNKAADCCANTDRELWRETAEGYYSPSIHVTETGSIGINVGGTVHVMPLKDWHGLATTVKMALDSLHILGIDVATPNVGIIELGEQRYNLGNALAALAAKHGP